MRRLLLLGVALVGVLLGAELFDSRGLPRLRMLDTQIARVRGENAHVLAENDRLRREIQALTGDSATIERVARDDLGFVRSDEVLFKVP